MNLFEQADEIGDKIRAERKAKKDAEDLANKAKDEALKEQKKRESK